MTPDQRERVRNDEEYYYDTRVRDRDVSRRSFNWVPLLLLPLFFVFGYVTRGAFDTTPQNGVNTPQFGVGGGPGTAVTPYPAGFIASPSTAPVTATPEATIDEEVQDVDSPTPTPTPTPRVTPRVTPDDTPSPEV